MMMQKEKTVGKAKTVGTLFSGNDLKKLIFPLIIEQILAVSVGMVDTMMVSSAGEAATSGVSLVDIINVLIINIFAAVATGGAVVASQYLGQKRKDRACQSADQLILVTGVVALVIMTLSILFRWQILNLIYKGVTEEVMKNAVIYLTISAISYPFLAVYNSCAALFRSMGNSKISMQASIIMNVINVIGDALFIFGFHWSVAGAAGAFLMWRLRDPKLDIRIGTTKGVNMRMVKQILHIGIPNGIENSIFQLGRVLTVSIIAMFGTTQIAANAIANNLDSMGVLPGTAMSLAIITVIGRCVGAGDFEQAEYYAKKMMKLTYVINGICCLVVILTMPVTLRLYGVSGETRHLGAVLALIHNGCAIFLWPAGFCLPNVMRAANDVKFPMCVSIASMFIFRIGLSYVTGVAMGLGAIGVWIAMIIDWIVRISFFVTRFFSGKWKTFYHGE